MHSHQSSTPTKPELYTIFVYGSLKRGMKAHFFLEDSTFVGTALTFEKYLLTSTRYPFLSKAKQLCHVKGEVYEIDQELLERLDQYEGAPDYYQREIIKVRLDGSEEIKEVQAYFCESEVGTKIHENGEYLL